MDWPTLIHVTGGGVGIILGAVALLLRKGSSQHKLAGHVFCVAMVVMAIPGGAISYANGKTFDVLSSLMTVYLVATAWAAFRPTTTRWLAIMMSYGSVCCLGYVSVELYGLVSGVRATDAPAGAGYVFATVLALALIGDYKLSQHSYDQTRLRVRHLWRMNFGLFIATGSFFGARPHLFPEWMQAYGVLLALAIAPILVMAYWRLRLRTSPAA